MDIAKFSYVNGYKSNFWLPLSEVQKQKIGRRKVKVWTPQKIENQISDFHFLKGRSGYSEAKMSSFICKNVTNMISNFLLDIKAKEEST